MPYVVLRVSEQSVPKLYLVKSAIEMLLPCMIDSPVAQLLYCVVYVNIFI